MNYDAPNDAVSFVALVWTIWLGFLLAWLVKKSKIVSDFTEWFRQKSMPVRILAVCAFTALSIFAGTKGGGNAPQSLPRPPLLLQVAELPPEPSLDLVSVHTNGVAFRTASSNAVEVATWRVIGGTEMGAWIEGSTNAPMFMVGTNPVFRCYASASGSVSFESMRRPPVGAALPDGTGLPVLCPLRAPLGFVPEANLASNVPPSRFWYDSLPGGGIVLTWENALLDRLPGRPVSLQVELRPSGDCAFRYDFPDELDPPPTNCVMGAQMGTNGVNALSVLGTNLLAATVWRVGGEPVTNGVSVADLLCTNGVLRTPAAFELRWKNTTGLDPEADTDNDGLTDWAETFLWGTDPDHDDTDGDGIADNVELMAGTDPFDADENGDGVPDGTSAAGWAANTLWAVNATNTAHSISVTLNSAVPAGSSASLIVGGLCIPLRSPSSWTLGLVPGQLYPYRLVVGGNTPVDLSIGPGETTPPMRGNMDALSIALWLDGMGGTFDGWSLGGSGNIAIPTLNLTWIPKIDENTHDSASGICIHDDDEVLFSWDVAPTELKTAIEHLQLQNLCEDHQYLALSVDAQHQYVEGLAEIPRGHLKFGQVCAMVSAHLCDTAYTNRQCSICGAYDYIYAEGHDIEYLTILPTAGNLVRSEVHFPGEYTGVFRESASPVPDLHQPLFYEDVQALMAEPPSGSEHMVEVEAVAHVNPADEPPDNDICTWRNFHGQSSSLPEIEWENTALFHVPLHGGVFKFRFQCSGFSDSECFLVLPLAGASIDALVSTEITHADAFAAKVNAKYCAIERNAPINGLKWFWVGGAGDFRGRPDNASSRTVWYYNQVNDDDGLGAVCTWKRRCMRVAKLSSFLVGYACEKIGVLKAFQDLSQLSGTINDSSAADSWLAGEFFARNMLSLDQCAEAIAQASWADSGGDKVRKLWPNLAPADNFVEPDSFWNPNTQFTAPGFLYMEDP